MDNQTKLEKYADIQAMVQKEIRALFPSLYSQEATKYGVASVPLHKHNGTDSPTIGGPSINEFAPLPAGDSTPPDGTAGVANPTLLGTQVIYNTTTQQLRSPATAYAMPLNIIHAGSGGDNTFKGGNAELGTAVLFVSGFDGAQLFFRIDRDGYSDKWWGVDLDQSV